VFSKGKIDQEIHLFCSPTKYEKLLRISPLLFESKVCFISESRDREAKETAYVIESTIEPLL
jgi:hypothetical protein